jgi:CO/xanthine dehydrogenase Mo-binding subunit
MGAYPNYAPIFHNWRCPCSGCTASRRSTPTSRAWSEHRAGGRYRGAGRPEAIYLVERIVDLAALAGLRPTVAPAQFHQTYDMPSDRSRAADSGDFAAVMARAMEKADWAGPAARRDEPDGAASCGIGMSIHRALRRGTATQSPRRSGRHRDADFGMQDNGQGHITTFVSCFRTNSGWTRAIFAWCRAIPMSCLRA